MKTLVPLRDAQPAQGMQFLADKLEDHGIALGCTVVIDTRFEPRSLLLMHPSMI